MVRSRHYSTNVAIEWRNSCLMCGRQWLDETCIFWCAECVGWMYDRRRELEEDTEDWA
jgi:hypothetical protein